jgi:hypothetical protein
VSRPPFLRACSIAYMYSCVNTNMYITTRLLPYWEWRTSTPRRRPPSKMGRRRGGLGRDGGVRLRVIWRGGAEGSPCWLGLIVYNAPYWVCVSGGFRGPFAPVRTSPPADRGVGDAELPGRLVVGEPAGLDQRAQRLEFTVELGGSHAVRACGLGERAMPAARARRSTTVRTGQSWRRC